MTLDLIIPDYFRKSLINSRGEAGKKWLDDLPEVVEKLSVQWQIKIFPPFMLSYNYVCPAERADGSSAVLKVEFTAEKARTEYEALKIFNGAGAVKIIEEDSESKALLLERAFSGTSLKSIKDDKKRTSIMIDVMKKLRKPAPKNHEFLFIEDWGESFKRHRKQFNGGVGPFEKQLFDKAEKTFFDLAESQKEKVLLHGDLHHGNILVTEREPYLAIDPKGIIGEAEYEVGAMLRNELPKDKKVAKKTLDQRINQLSEGLRYDKKRIRQWAFSQAVLAAVWVFEDHKKLDKPFLICAEILQSIN